MELYKSIVVLSQLLVAFQYRWIVTAIAKQIEQCYFLFQRKFQLRRSLFPKDR
jgi:hypothetical protein